MVAYTTHASITTSNSPHSDESRYTIIGRCNLLREKIAAPGHMLIMRPCKTTQVYLTNMKLPVLPGPIGYLSNCAFIVACSCRISFTSVIGIYVRPPDNQQA